MDYLHAYISFQLTLGGSDYTSISQSRTLRSGSTECVNIPIIDDTTQELTEVFLVTLSTSDAVRLENNTARVEIMDDDYGEIVWKLGCCFSQSLTILLSLLEIIN